MQVLKQIREIIEPQHSFERCPCCESYQIKETTQEDFYCFVCGIAWMTNKQIER